MYEEIEIYKCIISYAVLFKSKPLYSFYKYIIIKCHIDEITYKKTNRILKLNIPLSAKYTSATLCKS